MLTVREKIEIGMYTQKAFYPKKSDPDYAALRELFAKEGNTLYAQFKADLIEENGLAGHPKTDLCFNKAWEHGHANGYSDVVYYFEEFAELLK